MLICRSSQLTDLNLGYLCLIFTMSLGENCMCACFCIRKYTDIVSKEQRESYKGDFYAEYGEYRTLHAWIESITKRFMKFDARRKCLPPESKEYQVKKDESVSSPSYPFQKSTFSAQADPQYVYLLNYIDVVLKHLPGSVSETE